MKLENPKPIWKVWVKWIVTILVFLSSIAVTIFLVQPTITSDLAAQSNTILNGRLAITKTAINETIGVVDTFNQYVVEYERQDCDIAVSYDLKNNNNKLQSIVDKLNPTQREWDKVRYGPLTDREINTTKETALLDLVATGQGILKTANLYTELEGLISYLQGLRMLCSKATSVESNRNTALGSFCSEYTTLFAKWQRPSTDWISKIWQKSSAYGSSCKAIDYSTLLTSFVGYFASIADLVPEPITLKDQLNKSYEEAEVIVTKAKQSNQSIAQRRSSLSGVWYLLGW
jgi:hypothetical protein